MRVWVTLAGVATVAAGCGAPGGTPRTSRTGIHKIEHVIVIMQENRSFDNYFGTYPGADGIPMNRGVPTVCLPNRATGGCVRPFHDRHDVDIGGPHTRDQAVADIDGGKMDGFIGQLLTPAGTGCDEYLSPKGCPIDRTHPDVMGYHTSREIPNYWAYAKNF